MNLRDLRLRTRALFAPRRAERELDEELAFHLEREARRLIDQGLSPADARARALARFGPVPLAADECRDARGTALVDTTIRDVLYALRGFMRAPLVALTIVSTVALGLGLVAVAFTILNMILFRVDQVPDVHEMFAVERVRTATGERAAFTRAQFDALRRGTSVFTDAYAEVSGMDTRVDGRIVGGSFVTATFFQVVGVNAARGRPLTSEDEEPGGGHAAIVLSHRGWDRLFARDPAVLGRTLLVNGVTLTVVGVMPEGFRGLAVVPPDYWASLSLLPRVYPFHGDGDGDVGLRVVGRLRPGLSQETALAGLGVWETGRTTDEKLERGASSLTLLPWRGTVPQRREAVLVVAPLFFAFGLILLIGCANVANLLLARAVVRQREIGIRLSLGASRRRIVRQLLTESLLLALVAAAAGFAISRVVLEATINAVLTSIPPDIGDIVLVVPDADWRVLLFLLAGAFVSTAFFGLVPALQATRIEPLRTMRGEVAGDARPSRARNLLIAVQVSASALLLISAAVFLRSAMTATAANPGMRTADTLAVEIANEAVRTSVLQVLAAETSVAAVAASWPASFGPVRAAFAETAGAKAAVGYKFVSPEYFGVLDVGVVRGRTFTPAETTSTLSVAVVSETTARTLWPNAEAVGQIVRLEPDPESGTGADEPPLGSRTFTVVGVVRDVAGFRIAPLDPAVVYVPASATMPKASLTVRVHGDPDLAGRTLRDRLTIADREMVQVLGLSWVTRMETYFLLLAFWFTVALGGLALALTLSGLFGVLSYLVEQRTREIGVRMALGATARDVTRLVLSQSIGPVGFGLVIGGGSAAALATVLLATPAAAGIGQFVHVLDPVAYAASLFVILAACLAAASIPATRAARLDPTRTLRQD
jgi:predicted permease